MRATRKCCQGINTHRQNYERKKNERKHHEDRHPSSVRIGPSTNAPDATVDRLGDLPATEPG
jgi:hypothetical protein